MKRLITLFLLVPLLLAQAETKTEVFAPFVSRLKAQAQESSILLTWKESRDIKGPRHVYRYTEEINQDNFRQATYLGKLSADVNAYEDLPSGRENYFYAVLLEGSSQTIYEIFIPFRNITSRGVSIQTLPPEELIAARITGLQARVEDDAVLISFASSKPDRELLLFRSGSELSSPRDLLEAQHPLILEKNSTGFRDYPIPGVDVYYAVLDAGLYRIGKVDLENGVNTLTTPVRLPASGSRVGLPAPGPALRPVPLPYLLLSSGVESGRELSAASSFLLPQAGPSLSPATAAALENLLGGLPALSVPPVKVVLLAADRPSGGAAPVLPGEPVLQAILSAHLLKADYQNAALKLTDFLSLSRPQSLESRAHFYLGQALYFQGRVNEAFFEFLAAEDAHYQPVQIWLDACLFVLGKGSD
jgi:hypothetical protein